MDKLEEKYNILLTMYKNLKLLELNEKLGYETFLNSESIDKNPYNSETENSSFEAWNLGWLKAEKENRYNSLLKELIEVINIVDHIQELALGYGNEEIANKLDLINEKLAPHIISK